MREYGKIVPRFWTAGTGAQLRGNLVAQLAAAYLSTCPSASPIGIFYLPLVTMAHEMGVEPGQVRAAMAELERLGFALYDEANSMVWVPAMARVSIGEKLSGGDKRRPWLLKELEQHRGHRFHALFLAKYGPLYGIRGGVEAPPQGPTQAPWDAPPQAPSRPVPSPSEAARTVEETEQEQEQEQEQDPSGGGAGSGGPAPSPAPEPLPPERATPRPEPAPREPRAPKAARAAKPETPAAVVWRVWRELYAGRYRHGYSQAPPDGKAVLAYAANAQAQLEADQRPPEDYEPLVRHQLLAYLADRGSRDFSLIDRKHGLQWLGHNLAAYGTPWGRVRAPPRERDDEPPPPRRQVLDRSKPPLGVLATLGKG